MTSPGNKSTAGIFFLKIFLTIISLTCFKCYFSQSFSRPFFSDLHSILIFPLLFKLSLLLPPSRRCPALLVTTREFDLYRRDCELMAQLMKRNQRLLMDIYIQPGASHMSGRHSLAALEMVCLIPFISIYLMERLCTTTLIHLLLRP